MIAVSSRSIRSDPSRGGAVVALSGLLTTVALVGSERVAALLLLADVALAVGVVVLVLAPGRSSVVGTSRVGRIALSIFGLGPLASRLEPSPAQPWSVLTGMSVLLVVTVATLVAAVLVARAARVHGVARWALLAVAAHALLCAVMSSVPTGDLTLLYGGWHLELVRSIALLVWGTSLVLHDPAIRRRIASLHTAWKRTTDVGGATPASAQDRSAQP